jgi:hypothetical protein
MMPNGLCVFSWSLSDRLWTRRKRPENKKTPPAIKTNATSKHDEVTFADVTVVTQETGESV